MLGTWYLIERTRLGAYLRAATENRDLGARFGIKRATDDPLNLWARVALPRSRRAVSADQPGAPADGGGSDYRGVRGWS